ncbi:hypothetical protein [Flavobacterium sp.]|uniref:hypothetical protein n=1 Tax=Flavobacterium sp. TaxID=239 RepID=UPI00260926B0|nr:hypothetical protein [Flavobacterium sp.]
MRNLPIYLLFSILISCHEKYDEIDNQYFNKLSILDTLIDNKKVLVLKVGDSISDNYPHLLVKDKESDRKYLFKEYECELENDSIIRSYSPAFVYDENGGFRKNGIWVYTKFFTEGTFPFKSKGMKFSVDSIPQNWNQDLPKKEGIYLYKNNSLHILSTEQSEEKFREKEIDGFYFIPNKGRLYDKINIYNL